MLAGALAIGAALVLFGLRLGFWRRAAPPLPGAPQSSPPTTILLPVRDEEANVVPCLTTLLALCGRPAVRVIDDGSSDATAPLARELAARSRQLEVLTAPPLPTGWSGKLHALAFGLRGVTSPWVLLTDADTRHAPDALARAHAAAALYRLDLVSLAGQQRARGLLNGLLTPLVFALLDAWLGDWQPYADASARRPVANGQFILVRREALAALDDLAALPAGVADDVALAQALSERGYRCGFFRALDALEVEMYPSWRHAVAGWRRNLALLLGTAPGVTALALATALLPACGLVTAAALGHGAAALALWSAGALTSAGLRTSAASSPWLGLLYPLDALLFGLVVGLAVLDARRGQVQAWRGRELPRPQSRSAP